MIFDVTTATVISGLWLAYAIVDRATPFSPFDLWTMTSIFGAASVVGAVTGDFPPGVFVAAGFSAWCAYKAWKRRKPRQRKPSKVAGMVRDLGHRLVVTSS